ncbi:serpin family protein [Tissierella sp.]|uniref:serpin family protein n=1 Tax=Tissierella sp. TaxID=41274 RepID=UPI0028AFDAB6|nr:serpin family protein [Tissierella sp.]
MNEKKIFNAITDIDDELIEEAKANKEPGLKMKRILTLAASILVIISIGLLMRDRGGNEYIKPITEVIYPKAYAFDDYDNWRKIIDENPVDDNTIRVINDFAYKTGSLILKESEKNINYSPLSLYYSLALATTGAKAETEMELLNLLGMPDNQTLSEECGNLYRLLYKDNEIGKLKIANSIWLGKEINGQPVAFKDTFIENVVKNFYASSYNVDFSHKETGRTMSNWIAENTNGTLIPDIETNPQQILSIINTVYFYDQWINRFDKEKTLKDVFYLLNEGEVKVDFMNQTFGSAGFSKGTNFTRAGLGLKNGGRMVFILPDEGISTYELLSSPEQIKEIFEEGKDFHGEVVWKIPKFNFDSQLKLKDKLEALDIKLAFAPNADFTGITSHMAYISQIQQQTRISIDEEGVEASAFTQINYAGSAMPEGRADMILNRPFIYGITESNGSLLFVGVCINPLE